MELGLFAGTPLLGILRGIRNEHVVPLAETAADAGLRAIEVTMNTAGATGLIRRMREAAAGRLTVGAGTVLDTAQLDAALDAGASFVVQPTLVADVVHRCVEAGIPVFPGALTPQEIHAAWQAGASMVKVFPAGVFGPGYLREVKGPFRDIALLACGGVHAGNVAAYFEAGASAAAFGGSIFRADWLDAGRYDLIGTELRRILDAWRTTTEPVPAERESAT